MTRPPVTPTVCNVVELRSYDLHPGRRDDLIELFDRELVEPQEQVGMLVLGQFRDVDDTDRFVWLRGFSDLPSRVQSLRCFYEGPVWAEHGPKANATMVRSDDVYLLRPAGVRDWLHRYRPAQRRPRQAGGDGSGLVVLTIYPLLTASLRRQISVECESDVLARLENAGWPVIRTFVTETARNGYRRLPGS